MSKKIYYNVCDDNFLKNRLRKYPNILQYKKRNESLKSFYSRAVFCIDKMKNKFNVQYFQGNFETQIKVVKRFHELNIIFEATANERLSLFSLIKTIFKVVVILYHMYRIIIDDPDYFQFRKSY